MQIVVDIVSKGRYSRVMVVKQYSNPTEINKGELAEPVQVFIPAYANR